jgi:hypothetical protein
MEPADIEKEVISADIVIDVAEANESVISETNNFSDTIGAATGIEVDASTTELTENSIVSTNTTTNGPHQLHGTQSLPLKLQKKISQELRPGERILIAKSRVDRCVATGFIFVSVISVGVSLGLMCLWLYTYIRPLNEGGKRSLDVIFFMSPVILGGLFVFLGMLYLRLVLGFTICTAYVITDQRVIKIVHGVTIRSIESNYLSDIIIQGNEVVYHRERLIDPDGELHLNELSLPLKQDEREMVEMLHILKRRESNRTSTFDDHHLLSAISSNEMCPMLQARIEEVMDKLQAGEQIVKTVMPKSPFFSEGACWEGVGFCGLYIVLFAIGLGLVIPYMFFLIPLGILVIILSIRDSRRFLNTIYIITDRRAIRISPRGQPCHTDPSVYVFPPFQPYHVFRRDYSDGTGDVIFSHRWVKSNETGKYMRREDGFYRVSNAKDIEKTLKALPKWNIIPVHRERVNFMVIRLKALLTAAGPACRLKNAADGIYTNVSKKPSTSSRQEQETAQDTRQRLMDALQKNDLLKSVGEYEIFFPLDSTSLREIHAIMECLRGDTNNNRSYLGASSVLQHQQAPLSDKLSGTNVVRTEKVGSGFYSNLTKQPINTGYPLLDAYAEARKTVALESLITFHGQLKAEQREEIARQLRSSSAAAGQVTKSITASPGGTVVIGNTTSATNSAFLDVDTAARDAVRCLEHAMVVVAGEKTIYQSIFSKRVVSSREPVHSPEYITACVHAYSYVVSAVLDLSLDIIKHFFKKNAGLGLQKHPQPCITTVPTSTSEASETGAGSPSPLLSIRAASSAAAAGLRILDGVRILGPSLAKLCELSEYRGDSQQLLAGQLCISIHRTTVKQCARTLENLVKAIQTDSGDGDQYTLTSNVVRAIRIISPFVHAYKSVAKRRLVTMNEKNINAPTA